MSQTVHRNEVVIAGGGLAGIVAAYELIDRGRKVLLIEKDVEARFGGLAKESFGGVHMIGTPHQARLGIKDDPALAYADWERCAKFGPGDHWPRQWAKLYCDRSRDLIFEFLDAKGVEFLPVVNWPERGLHEVLNSVPRWHVTWGTGHELATRVIAALERHPKRANLEILFEHEVSDVLVEGGRAVGVVGKSMRDQQTFEARAERVVIASGGMCGGDLSMVRKHWFHEWGEPPEHMLNGAHMYGDGLLHEAVERAGGSLTHMDKQWHYAAGVHHPAKRKANDGLSLVPPRSALWFNAVGERIGPVPLLSYVDTRWLVESIVKQPGKYSWQVLNLAIAKKELAVSGGDFMTAFRHKKKALLVKHLLLGNQELVDRLARECPDDFVMADTLPELVEKMNARSLYGLKVDGARLEQDIRAYDDQIDRGEPFQADDQLRRLMQMRKYRGDRVRLCKDQKILDKKAKPLIAIREFILTRKSLGGIQTDLAGRVLKQDGTPMPGLYAVGEAAGFGGGGIHGIASLEGTFLGSCVLTGRVVGRAIAEG